MALLHVLYGPNSAGVKNLFWRQQWVSNFIEMTGSPLGVWGWFGFAIQSQLEMRPQNIQRKSTLMLNMASIGRWKINSDLIIFFHINFHQHHLLGVHTAHQRN